VAREHKVALRSGNRTKILWASQPRALRCDDVSADALLKLSLAGPEALTMAESIDRYRVLCAPDAKLTEVPFWILSIMAMLPGREQLRRVGLPIMRYLSEASEMGNPDEANQLLGALCITLEQWCQKRAQLSDRPSD
jgi:hypothetical protein